MHIALLANTDWLDEELASLKQLVIGLIDEHVRVTEVVPQNLPVEETGDFIERVEWRESAWSGMNYNRLIRLDECLRSLEIDLIHALDGRLWRSAWALGERLSLPVVFSATSYQDLRQAEVLAGRFNPQRCAMIASTEPIAVALRQRLGDRFLVQTIPYGVYPGNPDAKDRFTGEALCAIVAGSGVQDGSYQALLEGMVPFVGLNPEAQFFFDGQDSDQHQIWKAASRLGLLANLSLVPRRLGHRELLLRADVFLQPQALGKSRSITLRAMADGVPIVAQADLWLDCLFDNQTAWLIQDPSAKLWAGALDRICNDPQQVRQLRDNARQWVIQERSASKHVSGVLDIYRRLTGQTMKFPAC